MNTLVKLVVKDEDFTTKWNETEGLINIGGKILIGVEKRVVEAMEIINANIGKEIDASNSVSPLYAVFFPKSGKTTLLQSIFEEVKKDNLTNAIIISFSHSSPNPFKKIVGETDEEALYRLITDQLVSKEFKDANVGKIRKCDWEGLNKYIGDKRFVLFIDEISDLSREFDSDVADILKNYFLDKKNRYLVMTSCFQMRFDPGKLTYRSWFNIEMPEVENATDAQRMGSECSKITNFHLAFYGTNPAFLCSVLNEKFDIEDNFKSNVNGLEFNKTNFVLFLESLKEKNSHRRWKGFEHYSTLVLGNPRNKIKYSVCYIKYIMKEFSKTNECITYC